MAVMVCNECGNKFDSFIYADMAEWFYGHDCEVE